jgi:hypothetical protein
VAAFSLSLLNMFNNKTIPLKPIANETAILFMARGWLK